VPAKGGKDKSAFEGKQEGGQGGEGRQPVKSVGKRGNKQGSRCRGGGKKGGARKGVFPFKNQKKQRRVAEEVKKQNKGKEKRDPNRGGAWTVHQEKGGEERVAEEGKCVT